MQEQPAFQNDDALTRSTAVQQPSRGGWLGERRLSHIVAAAIAGLGLLAVLIFGIQSLTGGQSALERRESSPASLQAQEDPPLPAGWTDSYFSRAVSIPAQDPPLPEGWVDPYFARPPAMPGQEDPPLPEGWIDPYFQGAD